jgi:hypothetical protein
MSRAGRRPKVVEIEGTVRRARGEVAERAALFDFRQHGIRPWPCRGEPKLTSTVVLAASGPVGSADDDALWDVHEPI